ncbi:SDR family NAD(P)-dependent oxidoreductase [Leptobacterium flavescens]|uniref:SDR family NAD(P)-dependent oxidoreductase n=1 Tax=Leptobacterium flavescens TaxID=472055 RepID=A0A6P0ULS0_9FLAO|nr:SDR family oxidoreductase [Leptobacterium flavescens]NER13350.1 SDR family NAD(P)-dependent oxidoreductase [Leptobacterium flavescens]
MSKVVLITGGSSGIGKAIGLYLNEKGFKVYGSSRNPEKVTDFNAFELIPLDVTDQASVKEGVDAIIAKEGKIDVLINNAGIGITGAIEETPNTEVQKAFDTNFFGPINMMKAVLPSMRTNKGGLIINVTSIAGYMGLPFRGAYSATKGALELITEAMRMEVKDFGIQITNVAPGDFATNIASGRYHAPLLEGSPYRKPYKKTLEMMDAHVDEGGDPGDVAKLIYKIINKPKPRIHYKVGAFLQKFSIILKRILPDKTYEKMLSNHYKL